MADDRRIFPTATVLELVAGKKGADTGELANYLLGTTVTDEAAKKAAAPFAAAWLARWYPKFGDIDWNGDGDWKSIVASAKARLGDNLSLVPISGKLKTLVDEVLGALRESRESLMRQTDAAAKLEQKVRELEPLELAAKRLQKKNDELEAKLKAQKADLGALQRKVNEYQGKLAIDGDELMRTIRDAIKDNLKGFVAGGATAGAEEALAEAEAAPLASDSTTPGDEWGFKSSRKKKNDW